MNNETVVIYGKDINNNPITFEYGKINENITSLKLIFVNLTNDILNYINNMKNLKTLQIIDSEIIEDIYESFERLNVENLYINEVINFDIKMINYKEFKKLDLYNIDIDKDVEVKADILNIYNCNIIDYSIFEKSYIKNLSIQYNEYQKNTKIFTNPNFKLTIIDDYEETMVSIDE